MFKIIEKKLTQLPRYLKIWIRSFTGALTVFLTIGLLLLPLSSNSPTFQNVMLRTFTQALIFSIFAASWDFLAGIAGQVSFGHTIFLGVAGYVSAILVKYFSFPMWSSIFLGAFVAVLFGLIIGIPCLRLKGPYLALGTLAFSLIILLILIMGSLSQIPGLDIFFGGEGIPALPRLSSNPTIEYYYVLIFMIASFILLIRISKSKFGTILKSIRDDETGAEASGINITRYKIYAYMISGFFAGIAGSLYAHFITAVNPSGSFGLVNSFFAIVMASLGGIATISGSALGAFFFIFLEYILVQAGFGDMVYFLFAVLLILVIRFAEHGLLRPALERLKNLWDILLGR